MPIFRPRKFTFFPFLILFKRIESIDMTPCVISFLVINGFADACYVTDDWNYPSAYIMHVIFAIKFVNPTLFVYYQSGTQPL